LTLALVAAATALALRATGAKEILEPVMEKLFHTDAANVEPISCAAMWGAQLQLSSSLAALWSQQAAVAGPPSRATAH